MTLRKVVLSIVILADFILVPDVLAVGPQSSGNSELTDAVLFNAQILTMDGLGTTAAVVRIQGDQIAGVGQVLADVGPFSPTTRMIDLGGRTVVPGLIDTHVHFMRDAQAPGHRVDGVETAFSIAEMLAAIEARSRSVPAGEFLTVIGPIRANQFVENRLPNLAELDGAAPNHPVYLQVSFSGPAVTNSLGMSFFQSNGVNVTPTGSIQGSATPALTALVQDETPADAERAMLEYMAYANSVGLTSVTNFGFGRWVNVMPSPTVNIPFDLWQQGELSLRMHMAIGAQGPPSGGVYPVIPATQTAMTQLSAMGGPDDFLDVDRTGEFVVGGFGSTTAPFADAFGQIAAQGWAFSQHSGSFAEHEAHVAAMETVNAATPIANLRWALDHAFQVTSSQLDRLDAIGAGVTVQNQQYLIGNGGPPYRTIVDHGIHVGAGTDGTAISPLTPWASIYYMVTGKSVAGTVINGGQELTRMEALRVYTRGSAWFTFDDNKIGSIEAGKLADLVVLNEDFLTVTEDEIRELRSVMTVVGGEIVTVDAQAFPTYGCGFNPPGSLTALAGTPTIGTTWTLGVDNPLGTQPAGASAFLVVAAFPDPAFPCGTRFAGLGMSGPGEIGELLVDVNGPIVVMGPAFWGGTGNPSPFAIPVPNLAELVGLEGFVQGSIIDYTGTGSVFAGLTEAIAFRIL